MCPSYCALCLESKALRNSHIIPNSVFRRIKQLQNSGQLIQLDDSPHTPIQQAQESWCEYLLCADCEHIIGSYEFYGLSLIRENDTKKIQKHADGITFRDHNYAHFKLFLTSILWRASVSKQIFFSKVILPEKCREAARISLLQAKPLNPTRLGCKVLRMIDHTSEAEGGFSEASLKQFVISPIPRLKNQPYHYSFLFLIEGFLLEYFVSSIPHKQSKDQGVHKNRPIWLVPNKSIFKIPELFQFMVTAYGKHDRGITKIKI